MNVDEMSLGELRIKIAERMGYRYYWYDGLGECYLRDLGIQNTGAMITLTRRPDDYPVNMEFVPNWPADIAAADALLDDLESRSGHWELASLSGGGYQLAVIIDTPAEIRAFRAMGKTRSEAISRAWLKATAAAE